MLNQKKVEIFSRKFHKSLAKQFLEVAYTFYTTATPLLWQANLLSMQVPKNLQTNIHV